MVCGQPHSQHVLDRHAVRLASIIRPMARSSRWAVHYVVEVGSAPNRRPAPRRLLGPGREETSSISPRTNGHVVLDCKSEEKSLSWSRLTLISFVTCII
ncbi:hypothetical protein BVRB_020410 [Beta vulgaris subsp. vulgaris]|uniref:Uncharacterized protein n=1 Tax=Beta vulgaris subsp. vulgaris TaxID=3555 RepID=A0A0J8B3X0_BETVV|nr:hypothetical protein BVRB_020410 [Beta vulgaris subsp. vulgaris]